MSTVAPPRPDVSADAAPPDHHREPSRFDQWRSTWSVALRMARRDVRRHKGRSALVVVMVLLPTLLLSTVTTLAYTSDVQGAEQIPALMGTGQAYLDQPDTLRFQQAPDPSSGGSVGYGVDATPIPGYDREASTFANADAVARLVGATVVPLQSGQARTTVDGRRVVLDTLAIGSRGPLDGKVELTSGRWPAAPAADGSGPIEALVTAPGVGRGLPTTGSLTVTVDGEDRTLEIVGTADAKERWAQPGVVTTGLLRPDALSGGWIVTGDDPVTWPEVQRLNTYGLRVTSADVLRNPPPTSQVPADVREISAADTARNGLMFSLAAVMLLVTTTLLVGPAFAVSATRQRRTLALAASNGAHTPMLRRTVLAQALVLGALSAAVGVLLGVLLAYGVVLWDETRRYPSLQGPFDVRFGILAAIALCATGSTVVAALVPARRLGRLDIVGVMRGQSVSPRPSVLVLVAGVVLTVIGGTLTLGGTGVVEEPGPVTTLLSLTSVSGETLVVVGAVVLIVGSLLLVPMILAGVGRLGGRLPTALRMAARDLARHRARSAPSVAAVLAAVAGLTFGLTGLASDTEEQRRAYVPTTLSGEATVQGYLGGDLTKEQVQAAAPGLVVTPNTMFAYDPGRYATEPPLEAYRAPFVSVVPEGCRLEQTFGWTMTSQPVEGCMLAGTESSGSGQVLVLPADELVRRLDLSASDAAQVRAGAAVVYGSTAPTAHLVRGTYLMDPTATTSYDQDVQVDQDVTVPAVDVPRSPENIGRMLGTTLALASGTPTTQGWPTINLSWSVRTADGTPVTEERAEAVQQSLGDDVGVQLENGFQRDDRVVVAILLAVFAVLILVVTLTSTALTLAEQQSDQATLAALGATRGTRRVMAAAQAFLLAAVGCVLGVAVGIVPGIAIARPLTSSQGWDPMLGEPVGGSSTLVLPWLPMLVVGVLVPLVAAGLAAAGIRRAPQVTRRAT